jgi:hypothetical protein
VVQFRPDGGVEERQETAESLGLEPRDLSLFQPRPAGLDSPQRATLTPRGHLILFRTEAAAAVIFAERACLFPCRCGRTPPAAASPLPWSTNWGGTVSSGMRQRLSLSLQEAAVKDNSSKSRAGKSEKRRGPTARWGRPLDSAAQACSREPGGPRVQGQPGARQSARVRGRRKHRDSVAVAQLVLDHVVGGGGSLPFELCVLEGLLEVRAAAKRSSEAPGQHPLHFVSRFCAVPAGSLSQPRRRTGNTASSVCISRSGCCSDHSKVCVEHTATLVLESTSLVFKNGLEN